MCYLILLPFGVFSLFSFSFSCIWWDEKTVLPSLLFFGSSRLGRRLPLGGGAGGVDPSRRGRHRLRARRAGFALLAAAVAHFPVPRSSRSPLPRPPHRMRRIRGLRAALAGRRRGVALACVSKKMAMHGIQKEYVAKI
jgi:hypothetical protein